MTEKPLVSAVITTHNRLELLKRAVSSALGQTYSPMEVIVVDDGSTDGTESYCRNLKDVKYLRINPGESRGGNYARNRGILVASGQIVAFCDDDDYWLADKTMRQVELMRATGCDFVYCGRTAEVVKEDKMWMRDVLPVDSERGDISKTILWTIPFLTSALMAKREALLSTGMFDEKLRAWQEYELTIRLAQRSKTDFLKDSLVVYRVDIKDPQRLTNKFNQWRDSVRMIYRKHAALYGRLTFKERMRVRRLMHTDAIPRAQASGLRGRWYLHRILRKLYSFLS